MASPILGRFDTWLSEKLLNLNQDVDLDVFVSYISGILEADTPEDEKSESLFGILGELVVSFRLPLVVRGPAERQVWTADTSGRFVL